MGLIFWLSAQPDLPHAPEPWLDVVVKKTGHAALYGVLAWLYWGFLRGDGPPSGRARLLAFGLAVLYAVTDEVHQSFVPGRTPSPWDVVIDGVGAALAVRLRG
ncbi:MAG: VanZ family protein [Thermoflexales bacterium]|nr:VanZ family protein [Thermoflexales bacterium]